MSNSFAEALIKFIAFSDVMHDDLKYYLSQTQQYLEEIRGWYRNEKSDEIKSAGLIAAELEKRQAELCKITNEALDKLTDIYGKLI